MTTKNKAPQRPGPRAEARATPLTVDAANVFAERVGAAGLTRAERDELRASAARVHAHVSEFSRGGLSAEFAALTLHEHMRAQLTEIDAASAEIGRYRDVLLIGIGGSSLGTKAVCQALRGDLRSDLTLHFVENVDPYDLHLLLEQLDPADTALLCISKSGGTLETAVQFLVLRQWLTDRLGNDEARKRQWIVTDPAHGWLRGLAERERLNTLSVPPQVGGRYSVLSPVGLLPLAVLGVDVRDLLAGAAFNAARCTSAELDDNPALDMAAVYFLLDVKKSKRTAIMMPYVNRLRLFVDWYCQLWAESLGKRRDHADPAGTLPVRAMGAVDQHSQLQMYLESRTDKMFTFIELDQWEHRIPVPLPDEEGQAFPYLKGKTMADVIRAEFRATRDTITEVGHPNLTLTLPRLNEHVLGQLIDLYQRVTIYTGLLYGINPLDQPSVEKGKQRAIALLKQTGVH